LVANQPDRSTADANMKTTAPTVPTSIPPCRPGPGHPIVGVDDGGLHGREPVLDEKGTTTDLPQGDPSLQLGEEFGFG
jgi:hypothetical protein